MHRKFLIAVSEQKSSLFGVRFVGNFFSDKQNLKSTLFYCSPKPQAVWKDEKSIESDLRQKEQQKKILAKGKVVLDDARKACVDLGYPPENISLKLQAKEFSKVADIIREGDRGQYDAVVLGRRGLSMLEEVFDDSVSKDLFNQTFTFPLWLCRSSTLERKNVLLYIDGSETSFRMAEHVGFVLGLEKKHRVDVLVSEDLPDTKNVIEKCRGLLLEHGLPEVLIRQITVKKDNAAKLILSEAEKQRYAAVALGRSGREKNLLMRLFKGPVCSVLFRELHEAALWICH